MQCFELGVRSLDRPVGHSGRSARAASAGGLLVQAKPPLALRGWLSSSAQRGTLWRARAMVPSTVPCNLCRGHGNCLYCHAVPCTVAMLIRRCHMGYNLQVIHTDWALPGTTWCLDNHVNKQPDHSQLPIFSSQ